MLGKEPFPSFEETLPYVSSEDDHRAVVMKPISQESSVLKTVQESVNSAAIVQTKPGTKKKKTGENILGGVPIATNRDIQEKCAGNHMKNFLLMVTKEAGSPVKNV